MAIDHSNGHSIGAAVPPQDGCHSPLVSGVSIVLWSQRRATHAIVTEAGSVLGIMSRHHLSPTSGGGGGGGGREGEKKRECLQTDTFPCSCLGGDDGIGIDARSVSSKAS